MPPFWFGWLLISLLMLVIFPLYLEDYKILRCWWYWAYSLIAGLGGGTAFAAPDYAGTQILLGLMIMVAAFTGMCHGIHRSGLGAEPSADTIVRGSTLSK